MARRLRVKNKKRVRRLARQHKKNPGPKKDKIARARSRKAKLKKAYRMN